MTKARSNATANAAKGDLTVGTGTNLSGVLSAGSNGETLVLDSSTSTGLRYQGSQAAARNIAIGGGFDIWQRGTSFTSFPATNTYTADRWQAYRGGFATGMTITRQSTNDTTNLPFIQYCARVSRDSGNTSVETRNLQTSIESANVYPLSGRTFVLSFYARAGANYSASGSVLAGTVLSGTSTDMNYTSMSTIAATTNATLTTTWQRFSVSGTFGATVISAGVGFVAAASGTAGANDWFEVTGVQLELGSVATTFSRAGGTLQGELAACQRYYWRLTKETGIVGHMFKYLTTDGMGFVELPVPMRVTPTSMDSLNVQFQQTNLTNNAIFGPTLNSGYSTNSIAAFTFGQTGLASGTQGYAALTSSGFIAYSAEL